MLVSLRGAGSWTFFFTFGQSHASCFCLFPIFKLRLAEIYLPFWGVKVVLIFLSNSQQGSE